MLLLMLIFIFSIVISNFMIMLSLILSKKSFNDLEKLSAFECGFDPKSSARLPFSLHFFLITIIFLIFDVEIVLIMPMIMIFNICQMMHWFIISSLFIMILLAGLYFEWNNNMLNWTN
uniref:NADH-ubiquinone oxidoreductase chain 3 n=1 Tax=Phryganea bipunctata TaxID=1875852 RepID=A0A7D7JEH9_9NEOP|nr:NADH dehydrogenase subunit 3 [Phryganea bipunctata]QMP96690.1 NADH dehydrogenase subunit 3 [Phryganea bipunctata]